VKSKRWPWDCDSTLFYFRARWYDSAVGRFVSEDPINFAGDSVNLTTYVNNSVLNATDPSGLERRLYFFGHIWIELDDETKGSGKRSELHFCPGNPDFLIADAGETEYPRLFYISIDSTAKEDAILIQRWKDLEMLRVNDNRSSNIWLSPLNWTLLPSNCWTITPVMFFTETDGQLGTYGFECPPPAREKRDPRIPTPGWNPTGPTITPPTRNRPKY